MSLIFLKPYLQDKIWGGSRLRDIYGLDIPTETTGEAWLISAHQNGESIVTSPTEYKGMKLSELYRQYPALFGNPRSEEFPLLVKILDAEDDLSVQVHPGDKYAMNYEGEQGKAECWYILSAEEDSEIIYGHNAKSSGEFRSLIEEGKWDKLLRRRSVKEGDFFYVPAGTVHAVGKGLMILEIQQSSDITYRLYDYDRVDDGELRELHIDQSVDVTGCPHIDPVLEIKVEEYAGGVVTKLLSCEHFSVEKWSVSGGFDYNLPKQYYLATVIAGSGQLEANGTVYELNLAESFIIPNSISEINLSGEMELIVSNPEL